MTTYYNFALKIETRLAKRMGSETRNFNDVIAYVWFLYSLSDKNIHFRMKNMEYKKL